MPAAWWRDQHHPQLAQPGHCGDHARLVLAVTIDECPASSPTAAPARCHPWHHQCERVSHRGVRRAVRATASRLARHARWKPPRPLTAATAPRRARRRAPQRPASPPPVREPRARAADGAGVGLGVVAAVAGIVVLGLAGGAHREAGHRRARPVVRDAADDREARAAVGAVGERVADSAGRPGPTARPGRRRRSPRPRATGAAASPALVLATIRKSARPPRAARPRDALDDRQRRRLGAEPREEGVHRRRLALDLQHHAALVVEHPAAERQLGRQPVHVRPEADALHHALDTRPRTRCRHGNPRTSAW